MMRRACTVSVVRVVMMSWLATEALSATGLSTREVVLPVTVTGSQGSQLGPADLMVLEDGVEQSITSVTPITDVPTAFTLLIDTSNSMEREFENSRQVALDLARRLGAQDAVQVVTFSSSVNVLVKLTSNAADVERGIKRLRSDGSTSLHTALYAILRGLPSLPVAPSGAPRRNVVIVLSDGDDTSSLVPFNQVLEQAKRSQATIYALGPDRPTSRDQADLKRLAAATGGGWIVATGPPAAPAGFVDFIHRELASQYEIRYMSTNGHQDGKWRPLEVRSRRPGLKVRAKSGYFASSR